MSVQTRPRTTVGYKVNGDNPLISLAAYSYQHEYVLTRPAIQVFGRLMLLHFTSPVGKFVQFLHLMKAKSKVRVVPRKNRIPWLSLICKRPEPSAARNCMLWTYCWVLLYLPFLSSAFNLVLSQNFTLVYHNLTPQLLETVKKQKCKAEGVGLHKLRHKVLKGSSLYVRSKVKWRHASCHLSTLPIVQYISFAVP